MNLLIVTNHFHPESFRINDLAISIKSRGHEVSVLTALPDYPKGSFYDGYSLLKGPYHEEWEGISIHRFPLIPRGSGSSVRLAMQYASAIVGSNLRAPFIDISNIDSIFVFHTNPLFIALPAILLKKLYDLPLAMWVTDIWPEAIRATTGLRNPLLFKALTSNARWVYSNCDRILYSSKPFKNSLIKNCHEEKKLEYFPYWSEEIYQGRIEESHEVELLPDGFRIMFAGNIGKSQGLDIIIDAADKLKNAGITWIILGDGRERARLEKEIDRRLLTECFHFAGWVEKERVPAYFSKADALLITLVNDSFITKTLPSKVPSYLASDKPILAAAGTAVEQVINESGAGFCSPPGDGEALARNILKLKALSSEERHHLGMRGAEYCLEHFNKEKLLDRLEELFSELQQGC